MKLLLISVMLLSLLSANDDLTTVQQDIISAIPFSKRVQGNSTNFTIGYGTNLSGGINQAEAEYLLESTLTRTHESLIQHEWYNNLSEAHRRSILAYSYYIGITKFNKRKRLISALKHSYYSKAAYMIRYSKWCKNNHKICTPIADTIYK